MVPTQDEKGLPASALRPGSPSRIREVHPRARPWMTRGLQESTNPRQFWLESVDKWPRGQGCANLLLDDQAPQVHVKYLPTVDIDS